ncbi:uncharacterized protein TNCV_583831 [Trichonephila clavipes]|nr:uncharacterized protein TNCV_583831 [Trichonephila clavipes]
MTGDISDEPRGDRRSLMVKLTDSWLACQEFELSTAEDPLCWGTMRIKSVESSNVLPLCRGHSQIQWHVADLKVYPPCLNCNVTQAVPARILAYIGCHKSELLSNPATVLHCLKMHRFMDLI